MLETNLKLLTAAYGPSGREERVRTMLTRLAEPLCKELRTDALGNLIAFRPGSSGKKLMLCAHMDQIGLMVTDIDEKGFLRVARVGGINPVLAIARRVAFANGLLGTVYFDARKKKPGEAQVEDLFIDIGAQGREEAAAQVSIGDVAVFYSPLTLQGSRATGGALDNRVGCAVALSALTLPCPHDLYVVFSAQEEVGTRGAGPAAYGIGPDLAIALGKGPALKLLDGSVVVSAPVRRRMEEAAAAAGIPYQREVLTAGGTDTGVISRTGGGIPAGCISIPCRYIHSPVETCDLKDAEGAVKWLGAILEEEL